jgi:hypothetical protein
MRYEGQKTKFISKNTFFKISTKILKIIFLKRCSKIRRTALRLQVTLERTHRQKKKTNNLKTKKFNWLIGKTSHLSTDRWDICKAVIKPIWSYGAELWGCVSKFNIVIMQRSKILRAIANAPRYVTNRTLHTDFNIPYVSDVIHERINKYHNNLEAHPNPLLQPLLQSVNIMRLKRCWTLELQGPWGDIAGWTPYHFIAIHGIVAYFV